MGFLVLSIISSALVSIVMRCSTGKVRNEPAMFGANYAVCSCLAFLFSTGGNSAALWGRSGCFALVLGLLSGVMYLLGFVLLRKNILENGVVLAAVFMKLGVLVPTLLSVVLYREKMKPVGLIGFVLALLAIWIINGEGRQEQSGRAAEEPPFKGRQFLLLILLLAGGFTDFLAKIYEVHGSADMKDLYLVSTFATAFLLCVILSVRKRQMVNGRDLLWGALVGIPNYFSARFLLLSLGQMPAVAVYPAYNIGAILLVTLAGILAFRERVSTRKAAGILMILIALVLLNQ